MTKSVRRLFESFAPSNYDLSLTPDIKSMTFRGSVTIHGRKKGAPSKRLTFHQNGLTITAAAAVRHDKKGDQPVEITRLNHHNTFHEVRLHSEQPLYAGEYTVTLDFEAPITRGMTGLYPCFFQKDGEEHILLATQLESHHAREVFPCIDEPEAKATFGLTLTHDAELTALGNTPIATQTIADELATTKFETSPIMSSYLLAFVLGEIHAISGKTNSGVDVNIWGTVAQPASSFEFALDSAIRSIEFFEDYFGVPYPLPKADHIALPDFSSGAMENWGLVTYRESVLLLYPETASQSSRETIATVVAHETSHQWFGNLVTMKWWDDLWLNESFANMMEYAAVDAIFPDWHIWNSFIATEGLSALRRDAVPGVQAVRTPVHHPDEISTLFDPSIVYAKGGRLLYMLRSYIGDDAFRAGLTAYFQKHAYGNTTGADLWAALSEASDKDVAAFMNPWLERSGFPVVSVKSEGDKIALSQQHFLDDQSKIDATRIWPVPLFGATGDTLLDKAQHTVSASKLSSLGTINTGARGHYIVHYTDLAQRERLATSVSDGKLDVPDRLMLLSDSAMVGRAGLGSFSDTLRLLSSYADETSETVWDIMSLVVADAKRFVDSDPSIEPKLKALIRDISAKELERLGWDEKSDESTDDQKLRGTIIGLNSYADNEAVMTHALELFERYRAGEASPISTELRGIVFGATVKANVDGAVDWLIEQYKTTHDSDLRQDIAGSLSATRESTVAQRLLSLVQDASTVKPQDADRWVFYLLRSRYVGDLAWDWMEQHWSWIEQTYSHDKSYDYFPRFAAGVVNTPAKAAKYEAFFGSKADIMTLQRNIEIGRAEIIARLAWLERDLPAVQQFFTAR